MNARAELLDDPRIIDLELEYKNKVAEKARKSLFHQIVHCFEGYDPQPFHIQLCRLLDAFIEKKIKNLIIEMPPRHGKSEHASKHLPAAIFGRYPDRSVIAASYSHSLATDMLTYCGRIMASDEYREIFPNTRIPMVGEKRAGYRRNADMFEVVGRLGKYYGVGKGGGITGKGGDYIIIDDLIKTIADCTNSLLEKDWKWYVSTLMNRADNEDVSRLITFTRWADMDLIGRLLKLAKKDKRADQWVVVKFPAIMDGKAHKFDSRVSYSGAALWPERFGLEYLNKLKSADPEEFAGLYQQSPMIKGGNKVKKADFQFYDVIPDGLTIKKMFWDLTFSGANQRKNSKKGSYTVGQVWAKKDSNFYLLDQYRAKPDHRESKNAIRQMLNMWPEATDIKIERAANGYATQSDLEKSIPGIELITVKGSKEDRLELVIPYIKTGHVYLPANAPWLNDFLYEVLLFPRGENDDQVDTMSLALFVLSQGIAKMDFDLSFGMGQNLWKV